jgi:hypothetical protein
MDVEHLKSKADNVTYDVADATARAALGNCGMIAYSNKVTIPANSSKDINLSSLLPSGATLKGISSVSLNAYALPYVESGVVKTYVQAINTNLNKITIQNNTNAWTNYTLDFVIFYTTT